MFQSNVHIFTDLVFTHNVIFSQHLIDCFTVSPAVLLDEIEAAEAEGNDDRIEGVLCGAVKQLKMNRAKPDMTLYLSLMFLAKIKPNVFATEGVIEVYRIYSTGIYFCFWSRSLLC